MSEENKCPIWGTDCDDFANLGWDSRAIRSPRAGGKYKILVRAHATVGELDILEKAKLSRWIYEQNLSENIPEITSEIVESVQQWAMPSVTKRIDYLLQFVELETKGAIGMPVEFSPKMLAATVVANPSQMDYLIKQAADMRWVEITHTGDVPNIKEITAKGYQRIENLKSDRVDSDQAFVAMWFDDTMNEVWENGFEPAIVDAGYKPMRIDRKEHINKIDDEIIAEIRRSRFLVADFTSDDGPRGGVYYEAGFAHGLNIPVIYTCRKDCIDDIHFDTRQFNHLTWNTPEDLRKDLSRRISAVLGDGPHFIQSPISRL